MQIMLTYINILRWSYLSCCDFFFHCFFYLCDTINMIILMWYLRDYVIYSYRQNRCVDMQVLQRVTL